MHPPAYLLPFVKAFQAAANPAEAAPMKTYMKDQFDFLGIKAPIRKEIERAFLKKHGLPSAEDVEYIALWMWNRPEREFLYSAQTILDRFDKKIKPGSELQTLYETLITTAPWWDTVDMAAQNLIGPLFLRHPDLIRPAVDRWLASDHLWLQRTAIIFQNRYKTQTDEALLFELCAKMAGTDEFFIRKAIGWALRDYSKTNPQAVVEFVREHESKLSGLAKREALRRIGK